MNSVCWEVVIGTWNVTGNYLKKINARTTIKKLKLLCQFNQLQWLRLIFHQLKHSISKLEFEAGRNELVQILELGTIHKKHKTTHQHKEQKAINCRTFRCNSHSDESYFSGNFFFFLFEKDAPFNLQSEYFSRAAHWSSTENIQFRF